MADKVDRVPLIDEDEAARLLAVSPRTLATWRVRARGPAFVKVGGAVRYRLADLEAYVASRLRAEGEATLPAAPFTWGQAASGERRGSKP